VILEWPSASKRNVMYRIDTDVPACSCPGFYYRSWCKHLDEVKAEGLLDKRPTHKDIPEHTNCLICGVELPKSVTFRIPGRCPNCTYGARRQRKLSFSEAE